MPGTPSPMPPIRVRQGPEWLAHLYLNPPSWVNPLLQVVAVLVLIVVAHRIWESDGSVPASTQLVMGRIAGTVVAVIVGVLAMSNLTTSPYVVDVAVGFAVGYAGVTVALSERVRRRVRERWPDDDVRLRGAWLVLGVVAFVGPMLVQVCGRGMGLLGARIAVVAVAGGMVALSIASPGS